MMSAKYDRLPSSHQELLQKRLLIVEQYTSNWSLIFKTSRIASLKSIKHEKTHIRCFNKMHIPSSNQRFRRSFWPPFRIFTTPIMVAHANRHHDAGIFHQSEERPRKIVIRPQPV